MKKFAVMMMVALLLVMMAATAFAGTMYINRSNQKSVKLYNANDEVIATIPYRAAVETHSRSKIDSERMEVGYNGQWGWVYSKYLSSTRPAKVQPTATPKPENAFSGMKTVSNYDVIVRPSSANSYVNLRWAPSKGAQIRSIRYDGDVLRVLAKNKTWAQVYDETTGESGFMMLSFLEPVTK